MKLRLLIKGSKDIMNRSLLSKQGASVMSIFLYLRYYVLALALSVSIRPSYICLAVCLSGPLSVILHFC